MAVNRRSLLLAGAAAPLAGALLPGTAYAGAPGRARPDRTVELTDGWRFALANPDGITDPTGEYADAADPAYDDSGDPAGALRISEFTAPGG